MKKAKLIKQLISKKKNWTSLTSQIMFSQQNSELLYLDKWRRDALQYPLGPSISKVGTNKQINK